MLHSTRRYPGRMPRHYCPLRAMDKGRPSKDTNCNLLIDSGVYSTLLSETDWLKVKQRPGEAPINLKKCRTVFKPFGTKYQLPIRGRTKCIMRAAAGTQISMIVNVVEGDTELAET